MRNSTKEEELFHHQINKPIFGVPKTLGSTVGNKI
jgi:hypothetical protein